MATTNDIRDNVVRCILEFAAKSLPLAQRVDKLPTFREVENGTSLRAFGIGHFQKRPLALLFEQRQICQGLVDVMDNDETCPRLWQTVEDVVASVITHAMPTTRSARSSRRRR